MELAKLDGMQTNVSMHELFDAMYSGLDPIIKEVNGGVETIDFSIEAQKWKDAIKPKRATLIYDCRKVPVEISARTNFGRENLTVRPSILYVRNINTKELEFVIRHSETREEKAIARSHKTLRIRKYIPEPLLLAALEEKVASGDIFRITPEFKVIEPMQNDSLYSIREFINPALRDTNINTSTARKILAYLGTTGRLGLTDELERDINQYVVGNESLMNIDFDPALYSDNKHVHIESMNNFLKNIVGTHILKTKEVRDFKREIENVLVESDITDVFKYGANTINSLFEELGLTLQ